MAETTQATQTSPEPQATQEPQASQATVLFIVGSLRKGSFNHTLAELAASKLEGRANTAFLDYSDVPFFNQDIEFPAPESVTRVRAQVDAADAVWIVSPEYNYNIPAQLKNMLDWLSRPLVPRDYETPMPLTGTPTAISGAGGQMGTASGRKHLQALLLKMKAQVVGESGEGFVLPKQAWVEGMYRVPAEDEARLAAQAEALLAAMEA